jgi:hypothetical protein
LGENFAEGIFSSAVIFSQDWRLEVGCEVDLTAFKDEGLGSNAGSQLDGQMSCTMNNQLFIMIAISFCEVSIL